MTKSAVILLNWNGAEDTIECLNSIVKFEKKQHTFFIVDNGSDRENYLILEEWIMNQKVLTYNVVNTKEFNELSSVNEYDIYLIDGQQNLGFAKGNNLVLNKIKETFDLMTLLNNDTLLLENSLTKMKEVMKERNEIGVLSCDIRLYQNPKKLWNAGGYFTFYGDRKYFSEKVIDNDIKTGVKLKVTPFVTGCVMMIRQDTIKKIGVLSEQFFFGEEDFNYCMKLKESDIKVETLLTTSILHKVGTSISKASIDSNIVLRKNILHFSNRIINLQNFYTPIRWKVWKILYLNAVSFKLKIAGIDSKVFKEKVNYYVTKYDEISYDTFMEINSLNL